MQAGTCPSPSPAAQTLAVRRQRREGLPPRARDNGGPPLRGPCASPKPPPGRPHGGPCRSSALRAASSPPLGTRDGD